MRSGQLLQMPCQPFTSLQSHKQPGGDSTGCRCKTHQWNPSLLTLTDVLGHAHKPGKHEVQSIHRCFADQCCFLLQDDAHVDVFKRFASLCVCLATYDDMLMCRYITAAACYTGKVHLEHWCPHTLIVLPLKQSNPSKRPTLQCAGQQQTCSLVRRHFLLE